MKRGRFLLRFVDVVLILLFGFIVISDLDEDSMIVLPSSSETALPPLGPEVVLYIGITSDGNFIDERENVQLQDTVQLRRYIQNHRNRFGELAKVRIRANYDTRAKYTMQVAEICDDLNISKAIDVRLTGN